MSRNKRRKTSKDAAGEEVTIAAGNLMTVTTGDKLMLNKSADSKVTNGMPQKPGGLAAGRPPTAAKPPASVSSKKTNKTVTAFHQLIKELAKAEANDDVEGVAELKKRIGTLGGLKIYQLASIQGQANDRGGDSSIVLMEWLKPFATSIKETGSRLRMLEVGALSTKNACSRSGLFEMQRIDLYSQAEGIVQQDFMERAKPTTDKDHFDIISLSLVLNFVPDAEGRGAMLKHTTSFLDQTASRSMPKELQTMFPSLFLVLPVSCTVNSRYMNEERLTCMMASLGYVLLRVKQTAKLVYYLWQLRDKPGLHEQKFPKKLIKEGGARNNFCVVLK